MTNETQLMIAFMAIGAIIIQGIHTLVIKTHYVEGDYKTQELILLVMCFVLLMFCMFFTDLLEPGTNVTTKLFYVYIMIGALLWQLIRTIYISILYVFNKIKTTILLNEVIVTVMLFPIVVVFIIIKL
jgi:hypothetical protein